MKKFYPLFFILFTLFNSCSSDTPETAKPIAAFTLSATTVSPGQEIKVTNTSTSGAEIVSYSFRFGNDAISTEKEPTFFYSSPGEYGVTLAIKDANGAVATAVVSVTVTSDSVLSVENPAYANTDSDVYPLEIGIYNDKVFYTESYRSILTNTARLYRHVEYDEVAKTFTTKVISEKSVNSGKAKTTFLNNGNKIVTVVESLNYIGGHETELNSEWSHVRTGNTGQVSYGTLQNNDQYYFYGSYSQNPSIETRDNSGKLLSRKTYESVLKNAFIGSLIKTGNTYVGFGGKYEPSTTNPIKNYKPLILFFNENLEITSQKTFDLSSLDTTVQNWFDITGSFKVLKLSNGNLALYSHNELRITNAQGEELKLITFKNNGNIQDLIEVDNGFIASSFQKFEKYDNNGNVVKSISYTGTNNSGFVKKGNLIYFVTGRSDSYNNYSLYRVRLGAIDSNLIYQKL